MRKIIVLVLVSIAVLSCKKTESMPLSFDYGSIENGVYDNNYFKFKLPINPDWNLLNNEEANVIYDLGKDLSIGVEKMLNSFIKKLAN